MSACLIDSERYLLTCCRYIELNPVRAAMTISSMDYRWSSCHYNAYGRPDNVITPRPVYLSLAMDAASREAAYARLFAGAI